MLQNAYGNNNNKCKWEEEYIPENSLLIIPKVTIMSTFQNPVDQGIHNNNAARLLCGSQTPVARIYVPERKSVGPVGAKPGPFDWLFPAKSRTRSLSPV